MKISIEDERKIVQDYQSGMSGRNVAEENGISQSQVRRILQKYNVYSRPNKTSPKIEKIVLQKYSDNISSEKIATELGLNPSTICRILKRNGVELKKAKHFNRKYKIHEGFLDEIDTQEKAYFLGFMYADGCVHKSRSSFGITLHEKDKDILETFSMMFYDDIIISENDPYVEWGVSSRILHNKLVEHGCVPAKTFKVKLPHHLSKELMSHFLRGLYDGDGCINICESGRVRVILTGYHSFLKEVQEYLKTLGIGGILNEVKANVGSFVVSRKLDSQKILKYLYKDSSIHLGRKYQKYLEAMAILKTRNKTSEKYSTNIVSYQGQKLTKKYIESLPFSERDKIVDFLFDYFRRNGFPYETFNRDELIRDFSALRKASPILSDKEIHTLSTAGLKLFKHFCHHYYTVNNGKHPSFVDAFNDDEKLMKTIKNRLGYFFDTKESFNITGNMLRQGLRNSRVAFAASIFKPSVAKFFYEQFKAEHVLDISAGFGQRMLGAMAASTVKQYTGLDPWKTTISALESMRDFLHDHTETKVNLIEIGSERFNIGKFDFCFSSPPFFNKEVYSSHKTQAYSDGFDGFLDWWKCTAKNVHSMLDGKYFVINMDRNIINDMLPITSDLFELEDTYRINFKRGHYSKDSTDNYYILRKVR